MKNSERKSYVHFRTVELCEREPFWLTDLSTILQNECGIFFEKNGTDLIDIMEDMANSGLISKNVNGSFSAPEGASALWLKKFGVPTPSRVHFDITHNCNLKCPHCYKEAKYKSESTLISDVMSNAFVKQLLKVKPFLIEISGGEPTLVENLSDFLKTIKEKLSTKIKLSTNGYQLDEAQAYSISKFIDTVNISIDGFEKDHDSFRGHKGSFAQAVQAAKLFLKQDVNVTIASMITSFNVEYIDDFIKNMSFLGVHNLRFAPLQRVGRGKSQQILEKYGLPNTVLKHVYFKLAELRENYNTMNIETRDEMYGLQHKPFARIYKDKNRYTHCGVGRRLISINPHGDMVPCDFADQPELKLGNIVTDDFLSVWDNDDFLIKFRKMIDAGFSECEACDNYSLCGGGLICNSYSKFGSFNHPDPLCPYRPVMATANGNRRT